MANHENCHHDHDHDHNHECCGGHNHHEEEYPVIHLDLEDGESLDCIVYATFDFNGKSYIALVPEDDMEEEEGLLLYEYEELDDDEIDLKLIDEEDFDSVADEFERQFPIEEE
ncbi:Protein of uncharacterised function (DUF1292) [Urinicoccus massiliensis]|uniref:Protein of uncharacterized function (DUF1292) n=1 Tax=Urinicoccus massiliensis TaxID=1723382 RepID=A0A8H2M490_9FIRM|nr:DUF1292 domain-containing protein [Urinicoccus massiliensis]KGF09998.1 hypothetical protein HMPREF1633_11095 [Tissierellia bacterium S5-A11]VFB16292.1 Protein of uncharacterised function (DUF1292) [Urinicoccus massiliensis]